LPYELFHELKMCLLPQDVEFHTDGDTAMHLGNVRIECDPRKPITSSRDPRYFGPG
jgi:hypothetical protein